jgi:hypothetical protein
MNSPQPLAIISQSPFGGRVGVPGPGGTITTTTITVTISPVRSVVFA